MLIYFDSPQSETQWNLFNLKCFYVICSNRKEGSQTVIEKLVIQVSLNDPRHCE